MYPNLPNLYCDVDGVINPADKKLDNISMSSLKRQIPFIKDFLKVPIRFRWNQDVIAELASLPVNLIWLTTWNHDAVNLLEPLLGLKSSNMLPYRMKIYEIRNQRHKYDLLKNHQKNNPSDFIWVDDVATKHYDDAHWSEDYSRLIIRPNFKTGLTLEEVERIKEFLIPKR